METMRGLGSDVGEYVGGGQGEAESTTHPLVSDDVDEGTELDDYSLEDDEASSDDAKPLLVFYDCEATGLSIYNDHKLHQK